MGTLVLFSLIVFLVGLSFTSTGRDVKSFFAAGGAVPWWISGLSLFMSFFSAATFVAWGSVAYSEGWVAITMQWTMAVAGLLIGGFIAPRWRKTNTVTVAEFITQRLGYRIQKFYTYLFLLIAMFTTGAFLYPVAKIIQVSTGFPLTSCIVVVGGAITVYTAAGGLWAVIVTDVLQFIVLTAAVLIVVPLSFQEVGGIEGFVAAAPPGFFEALGDEFTLDFMVAFGLYNLVYIGGNWAYVQRYTSVAHPQDARKVGWLFAALYVISPLIWMLPPMIYRIVNPELEGLANEGAYLLMCQTVLPVGLLGLILGGMVFATSSSVNTTLNIAAGVFTNDVYRHFFPASSDRRTMQVARGATLGFGILTVVVALLVPTLGGIVEVILTVGALTGGALYLPPIWALFSQRQTGASVLAATLISLLLNVALKFLGENGGGALSRAEEMVAGVAIPILVLTVYELHYAARSPETTIRGRVSYFQSHSPDVVTDPISSEQDNLRGIRVIAYGVLAVGALIVGLGMLADFAQLLVIGTGGMVVLIGAILLIKVIRTQQSYNQSHHDSRTVH